MAERPGRDSNAGPGVGVVIVNYRTPELTVEAARSAMDEGCVEEIVVVENGSGDGSYQYLQTQFAGTKVHLVRSETNLGFGKGVNLGVNECHAALLFFLNSDAVVTSGSLKLLAEVLVGDPAVGMVAPAVYRPDGRLQGRAYGKLPAGRGMVFRTSIPFRRRAISRQYPGWVSGVAMMTWRADFLALGGFDPSFTMYLEDVDLCRRVAEDGKRVARQPTASVVHLGSRSKSSGLAPIEQFYTSKALYLEKVGASERQRRYARMVRVLRIGHARARLRLQTAHPKARAP